MWIYHILLELTRKPLLSSRSHFPLPHVEMKIVSCLGCQRNPMLVTVVCTCKKRECCCYQGKLHNHVQQEWPNGPLSPWEPLSLSIQKTRAGQITSWWRALASLAEDPGSAPNTYVRQLTTASKFSLRRSKVLFWLPLVLHSCGTNKLI